jgi:hypothetical protein
MEPSSPTSPNSTDSVSVAIASLAEQQRKTNEQLIRIHKALADVLRLLDGFTSSGSSFRAYQVDPMIMVYASLLGPVLSDRLDAQASKGDDYMADMTKGSAVLARHLLRTLDEYRSTREGMDYIESEMQGSTLFPGDPPSSNSSNEPPI